MLTPMPVRRRLRVLALLACIGAAMAPQIALGEPPSAANVAAARKHFEKARTYYGQGAYREAITELEAAHALDPSAKDLVFNLGVVHEKLSDIDEALNWFRAYTTMDLLPPERDRADAYIRRLEGAKRELEEKQAAQQANPPPPPEPAQSPVEPSARAVPSSNPSPSLPSQPPQPVPPPEPPQPAPPSSSNGRLDGLTVTAAGLTTATLAFGVVMGVKAAVDKPSSGYVSGRDGNAVHLQDLQDQAHREAVFADIGFATALVSGVSTAYLYFGRSRAVSTAPIGRATVSAEPLLGGGTLLLKGSF
jgi:tetratricopeptide (TPR) repeat protein